jgi:hypothetical protein
MNKMLKKYLQQIGSKGGKAKTSAKAKAARSNGKLGGRPKGSVMKKLTTLIIGSILTTHLMAQEPEDVKSYDPGTIEYQEDGSFFTEIFSFENSKKANNRRQLAKLLYPNGFTDKEIGILDKKAGGNGIVKYKNGQTFDSGKVKDEIAQTVASMNDLEALKLKHELKK